MKFRKKPVVIEAFQMTEERRTNNADWPEWMHHAWSLERGLPGSLYPTEEGICDGTLSIDTLEGQHLVSWGDWIIKGVKGELYPCKPDIFEQTYEPLSETDVSEIERCIKGRNINKNDILAAYSDFTKWCRDNPHLNLDSRPHTHGRTIGDGGYISDEKTRIAFAAWRAAIKAAEQAVLKSPELQALRKGAERIQFVADKDCMFDIRIQADGTTKYRLGWVAGTKWQDNWFDSPSAAIDAAMENKND